MTLPLIQSGAQSNSRYHPSALRVLHGEMFAMFSLLLAIGVLFHQAITGDWTVLSHHTLVSLAAIGVVCGPRSVWRLLLLMGVQLVNNSFL